MPTGRGSIVRALQRQDKATEGEAKPCRRAAACGAGVSPAVMHGGAAVLSPTLLVACLFVLCTGDPSGSPCGVRCRSWLAAGRGGSGNQPRLQHTLLDLRALPCVRFLRLRGGRRASEKGLHNDESSLVDPPDRQERSRQDGRRTDADDSSACKPPSIAMPFQLHAVAGSGPRGVGADQRDWFVSDVFETLSSWGGNAVPPHNATAAAPVPHINVFHVDKDGPVFRTQSPAPMAANTTVPSLPGSHAKRSRRDCSPVASGAPPAAGSGDEDGRAERDDDQADGFTSPFTHPLEHSDCAAPAVASTPMSPSELMTMLEACEGDNDTLSDLLKVLNIVPHHESASIEQQLQRALAARPRLILAYFRQRLIRVPNATQASKPLIHKP